MAQRYTKVTHTSWGSKILNSFVGALIGVLLFLGSFVVLWMNEGRTDWSAVARTSTPVSAAAVESSAEGKFVSVSGPLSAAEPLGDAPFLRDGPYVQITRSVEMFAWVEESESETRDNVGGGSTTTTTYSYEKRWTTAPRDSSSFEHPEGHTNPPMPVEGRTVTAAQASVGAYRVDPAEIDLPGGERLALRPELVTLAAGQRLAGDYIFMGKGTPDSPQIGDVRISYEALPSGTQVTAFGTQRGEALAPYMHRGEERFYRALAGSRDAAIAALRTEFVVMGWILRLVGFLMMWIGMMLFFGPISAFLDVLPFLGNLSGFAIGAATFGIALALSIVTIIISVIAHNIVLLIAVLLLFAGGVYMWSRTQRQAQPVRG
ncbi:MAG TPA: TMEM43 family protein [Roseiflexaceae bacterium]|nr:TMEM43 family protein [Roseiflexaceae bacterium]